MHDSSLTTENNIPSLHKCTLMNYTYLNLKLYSANDELVRDIGVSVTVGNLSPSYVIQNICHLSNEKSFSF